MSLKKFLAPNIAILLLLSFVWLTGFDRIYLETDHQLNLSKYMQVQQHIVNYYVGETDINELYKQSILGLVRALDGDDEEDENGESEQIELTNTPADTTSEDLNRTSICGACCRFDEA